MSYGVGRGTDVLELGRRIPVIVGRRSHRHGYTTKAYDGRTGGVRQSDGGHGVALQSGVSMPILHPMEGIG